MERVTKIGGGREELQVGGGEITRLFRARDMGREGYREHWTLGGLGEDIQSP